MKTKNTNKDAARDAGRFQISDLGQGEPRQWTVVSVHEGYCCRTRLNSKKKALQMAQGLIARSVSVRVEKGWSFGDKNQDGGPCWDQEDEFAQRLADPGYSN